MFRHQPTAPQHWLSACGHQTLSVAGLMTFNDLCQISCVTLQLTRQLSHYTLKDTL